MEVTLAAFQKRYQYKAPADLIGKGGFSDVYKAWDTQDEQYVALKIATASAGQKYDLTQEVRKIKKLQHPNLIAYYDLYEVSTGTKDIHGHDLNYQVAVMEYAEGGTLGDLLKNKPLTHTEAEELAEGIIDGLAYLHANNITHRDLKPANILLTTKDGKRIPKITDFGLAKNLAAGHTTSTMLVGTVEYMAPEFFKQAEGETTTTAADVWSIGVIFLEALTGIHPFGKTTQGKNNEQIIYNILSADLNPVLQNLRSPFKELIARCLIREPRLRPQNAGELRGLLHSSGDAFSERTQVIDRKQIVTAKEKPIAKWKKWGKALFDFDVRNGNWKKITARELLISLSIGIVSVILSLFLGLILFGVSKSRVYTLSSEKVALQSSLDSTENISKYRPYEFSKAYFKWGKKDTSGCNTPIGIIYRSIGIEKIELVNVPHKISHYKLPLGDWDDKDEIKNYRAFIYEIMHTYSENHFKNVENRMSDLELLEQSMKTTFKGDSRFKGYNIINEINSVSNLSLDRTENFVLPTGAKLLPTYIPYSFVPYYYLPVEIKMRINEVGWVEWFFKNRVDSLPDFKSYLLQHNANTPVKFKKFMSSYFPRTFNNYIFVEIPFLFDVAISDRIKQINYEIKEANGLWGYNSDKTVAAVSWIIGLTLFMILYPFRIFILLLIWAIKTLRTNI